MSSRWANATWLESADKLATAFFLLFGVIGALATTAGAPRWAVITLGGVGVLGAAVGFALKALHERAKPRAERAALLARPPLRVRDAAAIGLFYRIGVDAEAREALALLGREHDHAPYVERDLDAELRGSLLEASKRHTPTLIVASGRSKAGKSRALLEAVAAELEDAWLVLPKDPPALARLASISSPPELGEGALVVWLDDIELWARPGDQGLSPQTLEALGLWRRPVLVLATEGGKGIDLAGSEGARFGEITNDLLARARHFRLGPDVTESESLRLREHFGDDAAERIGAQGIGEFMIAAPRLIARLETGRECPEGQAIVWAAIDCQRAGLLRPLPVGWLGSLYRHYIPGPSSEADFTRGLRWATRPLYATTALLSRGTEPDTYVPYDFVVDYAQRRGREIEPALWDRLIDEYADSESDLSRMASVAYFAGDRVRSERAARGADERGSTDGAAKLGILLELGGDLAGAEAAYGRADERGSAAGAFSLGLLLKRRGERELAEAAWRRADERGHAGAAFTLGFLLRDRGEHEGAEAALRRADERGSAEGALGVALFLQERGDVAGAEAAFGRADERGSAEGALGLGFGFQERGDLEGAEAFYGRADERGSAEGALALGALLHARGDLGGAEGAFRRGDERGSVDGAFNLGLLLHRRGDAKGAEAALRRADERGSAEGALALGVLLQGRGDRDGAEAAFRRADERAQEVGDARIADAAANALRAFGS